jgi:hypothetical protein
MYRGSPGNHAGRNKGGKKIQKRYAKVWIDYHARKMSEILQDHISDKCLQIKSIAHRRNITCGSIRFEILIDRLSEILAVLGNSLKDYSLPVLQRPTVL